VNLSLVTGATGFIGQSLCAALVESGSEIRILGRKNPDYEADFYHWDLTQSLDALALDGVDTVFHLAGKAHALSTDYRDEAEYFPINVAGTRKLLEVAKDAGVRRFIFFSSVKAMWQDKEHCLDESCNFLPETMYGRSKLMAEQLVLNGGYVPEPVVLRLSMVYGPSDKGNLPRMIQSVQTNRFPPLPEFGNKRSMVHVDDVVRAAMLASEKPEAVGQIYIVTDGLDYSSRQIYELICQALAKPVPSWHVPCPFFKVLARVGDGIGFMAGKRFIFDSDVLSQLAGSACYCSKKIARELGFIPKHQLKSALPDMIYYLEQC